MKGLGSLFSDIDLPKRFRPVVPPLVTQIGVALVCWASIGVVRLLLNLIAPGAAPFALVFPAVMMATLFAGLISGSITLTLTLLWGWFVTIPQAAGQPIADPRNESVVAVIVLAGLFTLAVADIFGQAVRRAQYDRDRQIADRDLFLREFDHRVKNNFAIVISLLELQRRRADPVTADALAAALARVEGIARAHQYLNRGIPDQPGTVEIANYLADLCTALGDALSLARGITIRCHSDEAPVSRDRAVSIGLIVNELVTNAAKHAFVGRDEGVIDVGCRRVDTGLRITVADNGSGIADHVRNDRRSGLGTKLVDAFARQANGTISVDSDASGTRVTLDLAA